MTDQPTSHPAGVRPEAAVPAALARPDGPERRAQDRPAAAAPELDAEEEALRPEALARTGWADAPPAESFNRLTRTVATLLRVPMALISLVDERREWFLGQHGLALVELPRKVSFCEPVMAAKASLAVVDAWVDPRFAAHPLVQGEAHIRAFLSVPLCSRSGQALGTLCVLDRRAREFTEAELALLQRLGKAAEQLLNGC